MVDSDSGGEEDEDVQMEALVEEDATAEAGSDGEESVLAAPKKGRGRRGGRKGGKAATAPKRAAAAAKDEGTALTQSQGDSELFATVCATGAKASELKATCDVWAARLRRDEPGATRELLEFFLLACGVKDLRKKVAPVMDDEGGVDEVIEAAEESMSDANGGEDLWLPKNKKHKKLKAGFCAVWGCLVELLDGGSAQDSLLLREGAAEEGEGDGSQPRSEPSSLLESLVSYVTAASSQGPRDMRMAATHACVELTAALVGVADRVTKSRATLDRQMASKAGKTKGSETGLKAEAARLDGRLEALHSVMDALFAGVFTHRFRDMDARVRAACQEGLGRWVCAYPAHFFTESKLKYNAWLLSDNDASVRLASMSALEAIVRDLDEYAQQLEGYVTRFGPRLLQATGDTDVNVAAKAVSVLGALLRAELVAEDEVLPDIYPLLLDDAAPVRLAAAELLKEHHLDPLIATAADAGADEGGTSSKKKKATKKAAKAESAQRTTRAELTGLAEIAEELCTSGDAVDTLVDAMWGVADSLSDWSALVALLSDDGEEALDGVKRTRVAQMLSAAVRKASGVPIAAGDKNAARAFSKRTAAADAARKDATAHLITELPALLSQLGEEEETVGALAAVVPYLDLEMYGTAGEQGAAEQLAKELRGALKRHSDKVMLDECGGALRALEATDACASVAPVVIKGAAVDLAGAVRKAANAVLRGDGAAEASVALIAALRRAFVAQRQMGARLGGARAPVASLLSRVSAGELEVDSELAVALMQSSTAEVFNAVSADSKDDASTVREWASDLVDSAEALCGSSDERVRDIAASSLSDTLCLFGRCLPEDRRVDSTAEMCGKLWHACSESIRTAREKGDSDAAAAACRHALQCAGRPVFTNAIAEKEAAWLVSRMLSVWPDDDSKETAHLLKSVCARLAHSDFNGSWRAYSDALKLAFDTYATACADENDGEAGKAIERVSKLAKNLAATVKEQGVAFGKQQRKGDHTSRIAAQHATLHVVDRVLAEGVSFACEDVPESLLYLLAAMQPLLVRASRQGCQDVLELLEVKLSTIKQDSSKEWEAVGMFKAAVEEQQAKAELILAEITLGEAENNVAEDAPMGDANDNTPAALAVPAKEENEEELEEMLEEKANEETTEDETPAELEEDENEAPMSPPRRRKKASVGVALDDGVAKATRGTKRGTKAKGTAAAEAPRRQSKRRRS